MCTHQHIACTSTHTNTYQYTHKLKTNNEDISMLEPRPLSLCLLEYASRFANIIWAVWSLWWVRISIYGQLWRTLCQKDKFNQQVYMYGQTLFPAGHFCELIRARNSSWSLRISSLHVRTKRLQMSRNHSKLLFHFSTITQSVHGYTKEKILLKFAS